MARMLGAVSKPWCPTCRGTPGRDCPSRHVSKKARRRREKRLALAEWDPFDDDGRCCCGRPSDQCDGTGPWPTSTDLTADPWAHFGDATDEEQP